MSRRRALVVALVALVAVTAVAVARVRSRAKASFGADGAPAAGNSRVVALGWMGDFECFATCAIVDGRGDAGAIVDGDPTPDPLYGCLESARFRAAAVGVAKVRCGPSSPVDVEVRAPSSLEIELPREMHVGDVVELRVRAYDAAHVELPLGTAARYADFHVSGALRELPHNDMDIFSRGIRIVAGDEGDGRVDAAFDGLSTSRVVSVRAPLRDASSPDRDE